MQNSSQDIHDIVSIHRHWLEFWGTGGWAQDDAARLLSQSHLDWLVSLSECLNLWIRADSEKRLNAGELILAWANLGSLVEGSMKLFLSVYKNDYDNNPILGRKNKAIDPDILTLERLRQFFSKHVWTDSQFNKWNSWIEQIRDKRNAIHAYQHRELGDYSLFEESLHYYLRFILEIEGQVPYPDEQFHYPINIQKIITRVLYASD